jgi:hypothetical protein
MLPGSVDRGPPVSDSEIAPLEGQWGFRLPPDYRGFLREQNGGERSSYPRSEEEVVEDWAPRPYRFYSLGAAAAAGLSVEEVVGWVTALDGEDLLGEFLTEFPELTDDLEVQMRLCGGDGGPGYSPPELLPVAVGYHADLLLLRLDGPDAGAAHFCYDPDGYCEWDCHRVAGSFTELLRDLERWDYAEPPAAPDPARSLGPGSSWLARAGRAGKRWRSGGALRSDRPTHRRASLRASVSSDRSAQRHCRSRVST